MKQIRKHLCPLHLNPSSFLKLFMLSFTVFNAVHANTLSGVLHAADPTFDSVYGDEEFITLATGSRKVAREAPAIVSIIDQSQIRQSSARTLEEVLETVAGIHVSVSSAGYTPIYSIRGITSGFNQQALVMINDIPTTHVYNGDQGVGWSHMPLSVIERIEIVRGPGSVLYGADAYAGVINVITKSNSNHQSLIELSTGTYRTHALAGTHSTHTDQWEVSNTFELGSTAGFDAVVESDFQSFQDALEGTTASNAPGPVSAQKQWLDIWSQARSQNWVLDAGYQGRYGVEEVIGWFGALDDDGKKDAHKLFLSAKHDQTLESEARIEQHASLVYSEFDTRFYLLPTGNATYPAGLISELGYKQAMGRYNAAYSHQIHNKHQLRIGINTYFARLYNIYENKNFQSDFSPTPGNLLESRTDKDPGIFIKPATRKNIGIYIQDEYSYSDRSIFTFGLRYDYYNDFGSTFNPRAALVHTFSDKVTAKLLYGTAFLAPSLYQLFAINNPVRIGNPNLSPATITTIEASLLFQLDYDESLSFNIYQNSQKDIIETVQGQYENSGSQKGRGLEIEYKNYLNPFWTLRGNMAFTLNTDIKTNTDAPYVPQRQYYLANTWRVTTDLSITLENHFIGDRARAPDDDRKQLKNNLTSNIAILYEPMNSKLKTKFGITNIFNTDNREPTSFSPANLPGQYFPANDLPQPGLQVFASAQLEL